MVVIYDSLIRVGARKVPRMLGTDAAGIHLTVVGDGLGMKAFLLE
jgi:hypothetical protein